MSDDPLRWQVVLRDAEQEVRHWRRAHPEATLTEIETALDTRLREVRAELLAELATEAPTDDRCPACGGPLLDRGEQVRTLRTHGDAPISLTRSSATCPVCPTGRFPPR